MSNPAYRLALGRTTLESSGVRSDRPVLALRADADLDAPAAALEIRIGQPADLPVAVGDRAELALGYGRELTTVFTGDVDRIEPGLEAVRVWAMSEAARLLRLRVNQAYANRTAGEIVADLAGQAGVRTRTVEAGLDLPFYAVEDVRDAFRHCRDLAERSGFDLYVTPAGELVFAAADEVVPDRVFAYGRAVLALEVASAPPTFGRVEVWGESPASSEGVEAASWLVRSFSNFVGTAGRGSTLRLSDAAIRTKEAAVASAEGRLAAVARRATHGVAVLLGDAKVTLGDGVVFAGTPDDRLRGPFEVRRVTHRFDKDEGFTTRLELRGSGTVGGLP